MQAHYYNHETKTIITSDLQHNEKDIDNDDDRINYICVTKIGPDGPIFYTHALQDIKRIDHIEANNDESIFICYAKENDTNKEFVIYLRQDGVKTPILDSILDSSAYALGIISSYDTYAFSNQKNLLYLANHHWWAIFDISQQMIIETIHSIDTNMEFIKGIRFNKDHSILLVYTEQKIFIGKKQKDGSFRFESLDLSMLVKKLNINKLFIGKVCLHPSEKLFYLEINLNNSVVFYIVDFSTLKIIYSSQHNISYSYHLPYEIRFLSDDILLLGCKHSSDYFLNIRTGNFWTKEKKGTRIGLTADHMNSIEVETIYDQGHTTHCVRLCPLFDEHVIQTTALLNSGKFPLLLFDIVEKPSTIIALPEQQLAEYTNFNQNLQTVLSASKTITDQSKKSYYTALFKRMYPTAKRYFIMTAILIGCLTCGYAMTKLEGYIPEDKLDRSNREAFWNAMARLIRFGMYLYSN